MNRIRVLITSLKFDVVCTCPKCSKETEETFILYDGFENNVALKKILKGKGFAFETTCKCGNIYGYFCDPLERINL